MGHGFSNRELLEIKNKLKNNWERYTPGARFPKNWAPWRPSANNVPDAIVTDVRQSSVIEITAGDITPSDVFATGYSLRFARVIRVRSDKNWNECLDVAGLNTVINNFNAGIRKEKLPENDDSKRKRVPTKRA